MADYESYFPPTSDQWTGRFVRLPYANQERQVERQSEHALVGDHTEPAHSDAARTKSEQEWSVRKPEADSRAVPKDRVPEEVRLEHGLSTYLPPGKSIALRLTDNRYAIISVKRGRDSYRVRAHRMFACAEPRLVRALARYVVHNDPRASALLSEFIEQHQHLIAKQPKRKQRLVLRTQGRVHDLAAIFDRLNHRYFADRHRARITWGPTRRVRQQRSVKVGSYSVEDRLIRVHPVLDQEMVPSYFLEWIVFHEMLHGKHAIRKVGRRRSFHPPEFSHEEERFAEYGRARLWERANMDRLLGN